MTIEWCDLCGRKSEFEPDPRMPYAMSCQACGHLRVERTRPVRVTSWLDLSQPRGDR